MLPVVASADESKCIVNHPSDLVWLTKHLKNGPRKSGWAIRDEEMLAITDIQPFDSF
jgi:hypothetical protein